MAIKESHVIQHGGRGRQMAADLGSNKVCYGKHGQLQNGRTPRADRADHGCHQVIGCICLCYSFCGLQMTLQIAEWISAVTQILQGADKV